MNVEKHPDCLGFTSTINPETCQCQYVLFFFLPGRAAAATKLPPTIALWPAVFFTFWLQAITDVAADSRKNTGAHFPFLSCRILHFHFFLHSRSYLCLCFFCFFALNAKADTTGFVIFTTSLRLRSDTARPPTFPHSATPHHTIHCGGYLCLRTLGIIQHRHLTGRDTSSSIQSQTPKISVAHFWCIIWPDFVAASPLVTLSTTSCRCFSSRGV